MSKRPWILLLTLLSSMACFSQYTIERVASYIPYRSDSTDLQVVLHMPYAGSTVPRIEGDTAQLSKAGLITLDIVCTDYPSYASLAALNESRLQTFLSLFPQIDRSRISNITIYRQLIGADKRKAQQMFHGIVARFRPLQGSQTGRQDLQKLEEILNRLTDLTRSREVALQKRTKRSSATYRPAPGLIYRDGIRDTGSRRTIYRRRTEVTGVEEGVLKKFSRRDSIFKHADSMMVTTPLFAWRKKLISKEVYTQFKTSESITLYFTNTWDTFRTRVDVPIALDGSIGAFLVTIPDSTVYHTLSRNRWSNTAIVADVTGSMYQYTVQLLIWLRIHSLNALTSHYAFFNDGDDKPDRFKNIGSTGGIYTKTCSSFDEVKQLMMTAMNRGSGGDNGENYIEALMRAEEAFPNLEYTVLIADNWSAIKDKVLIPQLKKPVRIILCGVSNFRINTDFMWLARATGGSLHLMEQDLSQLSKLKENDSIEVGFRTYKLLGGKFVDVTKER